MILHDFCFTSLPGPPFIQHQVVPSRRTGNWGCARTWTLQRHQTPSHRHLSADRSPWPSPKKRTHFTTRTFLLALYPASSMWNCYICGIYIYNTVHIYLHIMYYNVWCCGFVILTPCILPLWMDVLRFRRSLLSGRSLHDKGLASQNPLDLVRIWTNLARGNEWFVVILEMTW